MPTDRWSSSSPRTGGAGLTSRVQEGDTARHRVEVRGGRLSSYIQRPVDLLKIDIEGAEHRVIADLAEAGSLALVRRMIIEYHHHVEPTEDRLGEMLSRLEAAGFGYQIAAPAAGARHEGSFEDIVILAYAKRHVNGMKSGSTVDLGGAR